MRRSWHRSAGAATVAGLMTLGISGCTTEQEAPDYPDVRWVGAAPTGSLERDPWVGAVRTELAAEAVARNRNDFSIPELAASATSSYVDRESADAVQTLRNHGSTTLVPGPLPFAPTEVEVGYRDQGEDFAAVRGCVAGNWSMDPGESLGDMSGFGREYRLERDHAGSIRVASVSGLPGLGCDTVGPLPVAVFDPVPEPSGVTDSGDLVRPDGTRDAPRRG